MIVYNRIVRTNSSNTNTSEGYDALCIELLECTLLFSKAFGETFVECLSGIYVAST